MELEECKARMLAGQHLTQRAQSLTVCQDLNGIQAQFPTAALHALRIRSQGEPSTHELVKSWTLRGTMHLFAREDLPLYLHEGRTPFLRPADRFQDDEAMTLERKRLFADIILRAVDHGVCQREELRVLCRENGLTELEEESAFNSWGGLIRALAENGKLCYQGGTDKQFMCCPPFEPMAAQTAQAKMARRYFTHCGPATVKDAAYFFGWPQRTVKKAMEALPLETVQADGKQRYFIDEGRADLPDIPPCILLANFDPLMLCYEKKESLFLPSEYLRGIFNLSGIVMSAVLLNGTVAARWKHKDGKLTVIPFRSLNGKEQTLVAQTAEACFGNLKKVSWEE